MRQGDAETERVREDWAKASRREREREEGKEDHEIDNACYCG